MIAIKIIAIMVIGYDDCDYDEYDCDSDFNNCNSVYIVSDQNDGCEFDCDND